ncbi:unnamed protein product, partial [Ilex paraguariensis]
PKLKLITDVELKLDDEEQCPNLAHGAAHAKDISETDDDRVDHYCPYQRKEKNTGA